MPGHGLHRVWLSGGPDTHKTPFSVVFIGASSQIVHVGTGHSELLCHSSVRAVKINTGPVSWTQTQSLDTANPAEKAAWMEQTSLRKMQVPAVAQTTYSGKCVCARPAPAHGWGEVAQNPHPHIQKSFSPAILLPDMNAPH